MLSTGRFVTKPLNKEETFAAKHFLYQVYADQLGWKPEAGNPSGWIIKSDSDGPYFHDIYNQSAQWFGVFEGSRMAASGRLLFPVDSKLEIELYDKIPEDFKNGEKKRVEMNRIAVADAYNGTAVPALLFSEIISYARGNGIDYIFTAAPENTVDVVRMLDFQILHQFKYNKNDAHPAFCAVFDVMDDEKVQNIIMSLKRMNITIRF